MLIKIKIEKDKLQFIKQINKKIYFSYDILRFVNYKFLWYYRHTKKTRNYQFFKKQMKYETNCVFSCSGDNDIVYRRL